MNTKTALVAPSCRLREWADMILECRRRPEYMSVKQWCEEHSITVASSKSEMSFVTAIVSSLYLRTAVG